MNAKRKMLGRRRLVTAIDVRPFRFERRSEGRYALEGEAMAAFYNDEGALSLTVVTLVNESSRGLGLVSPVRVEPGAMFSLHARGRPLPHATGVVARCDGIEGGWSIGLSCNLRRAA